MSQKLNLKAKGIVTDPNQLSSVPEGAMIVAENVVIDRENIVQPRRGFNKYGNTFGTDDDRLKQLLTYKNRILAHYNDKLIFNNNPHNNLVDGNFLQFDGSYEELDPGLRIRSVESNKNFFFTTNDGIKKISARTAADFTTAAGFIIDAGEAKALDITGTFLSAADGFLPPNSEVAYRLIWSKKDINNNLIAGSPSSRLVMSNSTGSNANVEIETVIPETIGPTDFYQLYRSAVFTATGSLTLDDIDPGDELQLVYEDFPTAAQLVSGIVNIIDLVSEDFRAGGLPLYTNPSSGDGIQSANEPPPKAKDMAMYQSTVFYANTETRARTTLNLLGVGAFVSGTSSITIDNGIDPAQTYTFVGEKEITNVDFTTYVGTIPADLDGTYFLINSSSDKRKYYVWYDNTKTSQIIDFTNYIGVIPDDLNEKFFVLRTKDRDRTYYVWYDATGTAIDPGLDPLNGLTGFAGIKVDISSGVTTTSQLATATDTEITTNDVDNDFDTGVVGPILTVQTESFDDTQYEVVENILKGFSFTFSTPVNSDPANDLNTNTDVVGRIGIRVNISRGVITTAQVADATAASIQEQDSALDFDVSYTPAATDLDITNTNNGNTTDARDSSINPIGNGFAITVTQQGDGEDVLGTITATTIGATITITSADNRLSNGDNIRITGSDTTPSIDGDYSVSNVTRDTFDITPASPVLVAGTTGSWRQIDNHVLLSAAASPAQQIDETARSLVNIINKNADETVYAFYLSGPNDLPGQILFEVKDIGTNQFSIVADSTSTGASFNPSLPPVANALPVVGEAEIKPNRIYFAKLQQPEAVPSLNFLDVGPEDKAIQRILALRESLFILKDDGVYRLTGLDGNYNVDLFDESTKIIAPDTAVVINNQIYCLTNLGIVTISDTGVSIISSPIATELQIFTSASYDYVNTSFGVSYENDYSYILFLPKTTLDTVATFAFRYGTKTQTFTTYELSKTCGLVNPGDDKLYFGPADANYIERERKIFNRTDFADRDFELTIPANSIDGTNLNLSSSVDITIGDALVQTQYLTIAEFNQLLQKIDLDPSVGQAEVTRFDFSSYSGAIPLDLHGKYFNLFSATDATRYVVFYDAQGDLPEIDVTVFPDVAGAQQIRVDISTGITTKALLAEATKTSIQTATLDFIVSYTSGQELFRTTNVRSGETTDASDGLSNPVADGFIITVLTQGMGDYFETLQAVSGNNIITKLVSLATKLDSDPGVADSDYLASIGTYSGVASVVTFGNPTVITKIAHGIQTGRIVTVTASTTTPNINGDYVATKISANQFSIPITTTVGGTCNWSAGLTTFKQAQGAFNTIVNKLNNDAGVTYQNYLLSEGTKEFEVLIIDKALTTTDVTMQFSMPLLEGPVTIYESIQCNVQYTPETFGDTSILKQISESTVIFENTSFSRATVAFKTDLSPGYEEINFLKSGKGDFGYFIWSEHNWGGGGSGVPLRTYIPRQKQRCRYIQLEFIHNSAREEFGLYGHSYTFRAISERGYRS